MGHKNGHSIGLGALLTVTLAGLSCSGACDGNRGRARSARTTAKMDQVSQYRVFERSFENDYPYANKLAGVELRSTYTTPSGRKIEFTGFFDGDGQGGGDAHSGNVWRLRFMPDELGPWSYAWSWSDDTPGGEDVFESVSDGAGPGILRPYQTNPLWFAYNGTQPVWIKSYYESGHGAIAQPFDWITANVYQPMLDRGYNHLQVNWLLSLCCANQWYTDGPPQSTTDLMLYQSSQPSSTMRFDVWQMMERHVAWLNDRNVGLHMFLGFEGGRNGGPDWGSLGDPEKDFFVRYVVARLAPFANLAGWNFNWEVPGDRSTHELGWAQLIEKYDVFNHLRTYEDQKPSVNEYQRPEYTFAGIENQGMSVSAKLPYSHHQASLVSYVPGKPVYMMEGNGLWNRYWGAGPDTIRQSAWATVTAGASFAWNGHQGAVAAGLPLTAHGPQGLPFYGDENPNAATARQIDVLAKVMTEEVTFHRMSPQDALLSGHQAQFVWCLAEPGAQYLVFASAGGLFTLTLAPGQYGNNVWIDARTGAAQPLAPIEATDQLAQPFTPPDMATDWVLVVRAGVAAPG
jgi:hypothetical protein